MKIRNLSHFLPKRFYKVLFFALVFGLPFLDALIIVFSGRIPFWYDPARELLLALEKFTLIGPPSGIPGLFYGPYWIWALKGLLFFTKDPKIITLIYFTIPYCLIFPLVLFRFRTIFSLKVIISLWLLFVYSFLFNYSTQMWNINLTPILILIYIMLFFLNYSKRTTKSLLTIFIIGLLAGIIANFNLAQGAGIILGSFIFIVLESAFAIFKNKNKAQEVIFRTKIILTFILGIFTSFTPFLVFEYRHGFNQINSLIAAILSPAAVTGQTGILKTDIPLQILGVFNHLLGLRGEIALGVNIIIVLILSYLLLKRKIVFSQKEKRLLYLTLVLLITTSSLFMISKTATWSYHFIGIEILFLLFIGLIVNKVRFLRNLLIVWVIILGIINIYKFGRFVLIVATEPNNLSSLGTKTQVVKSIYNDANKTNSAVSAYSSSLYTFDYDYLFIWLGGKNTSHYPEEVLEKETVYLIIPQTSKEIEEDFIHFMTPDKIFKTNALWESSDGTKVVKRKRR